MTRSALTFDDFKLHNDIRAAIHACAYTEPTPIQRMVIPHALAGRDVLGASQTGSGKTAAFLWPVLHHLMASKRLKQPRALVVTPTRELAVQVYESALRYKGALNLHLALVVGGLDSHWQQQELKAGCDLVVGTPGRLIEHVMQGAFTLEQVQHVVLDEADMLLEMGFYADTRRLLRATHPKHQTLFFSATMHEKVESWAGSELQDAVRVEADRASSLVATLQETQYRIKPSAKHHALLRLLETRQSGGWLVFVNHKSYASKLCEWLSAAGVSCDAVHGDRSQQDRLKAVKAFKAGKVRVLVGTDVAARGLDIPGVTTVVNLDWPVESLEYVHRAGRTARMGRDGLTISFTSDEEVPKLREVQGLTGREIPEAVIPDFDQERRFEALLPPLVKRKRDDKDVTQDSRSARGSEREKSAGRSKATSAESGAAKKARASKLGREFSKRARKSNPLTKSGSVKVKRKGVVSKKAAAPKPKSKSPAGKRRKR